MEDALFVLQGLVLKFGGAEERLAISTICAALGESTNSSHNNAKDAICPHVKSVCSHDGDDCTGIVGVCEDWK